jgi:threonine synthase
MKIVHARTGLQVDPHTAVGLTATRVMREADDVVTLATAHPGKFPDAVALSTGKVPELPQRLQWIMSAHERYETLPNSLDALRDHVALLQRRH